MKSGSSKWNDLENMIGWRGDIADLRQFVLLVMNKYAERNPKGASATVRFYFDEDSESTPTERNFHVRARDILYVTYQFMLAEFGEEAVTDIYRLPVNEQDLYEAIVGVPV